MTSDIVGDIRSEIMRLVSAYEKEKAEKEALNDELMECRAMIEDCRKHITELERQIDSLKLTDAFMATSKDRREARERIDRMIRSIDRCMSLIGD